MKRIQVQEKPMSKNILSPRILPCENKFNSAIDLIRSRSAHNCNNPPIQLEQNKVEIDSKVYHRSITNQTELQTKSTLGSEVDFDEKKQSCENEFKSELEKYKKFFLESGVQNEQLRLQIEELKQENERLRFRIQTVLKIPQQPQPTQSQQQNELLRHHEFQRIQLQFKQVSEQFSDLKAAQQGMQQQLIQKESLIQSLQNQCENQNKKLLEVQGKQSNPIDESKFSSNQSLANEMAVNSSFDSNQSVMIVRLPEMQNQLQEIKQKVGIYGISDLNASISVLEQIIHDLMQLINWKTKPVDTGSIQSKQANIKVNEYLRSQSSVQLSRQTSLHSSKPTENKQQNNINDMMQMVLIQSKEIESLISSSKCLLNRKHR